MIEWVIVKGFNEPINPNSLQQELWQESRYYVFRKITDHANAAMLHFSSPTLPDLSVRSFMVVLKEIFFGVTYSMQSTGVVICYRKWSTCIRPVFTQAYDI